VGGAATVQSHPFFRGVSWSNLLHEAPFFPPRLRASEAGIQSAQHRLPLSQPPPSAPAKFFEGRSLPFLGFSYTHDLAVCVDRDAIASCEACTRRESARSLLPSQSGRSAAQATRTAHADICRLQTERTLQEAKCKAAEKLAEEHWVSLQATTAALAETESALEVERRSIA
jgi:hypothetical protein